MKTKNNLIICLFAALMILAVFASSAEAVTLRDIRPIGTSQCTKSCPCKLEYTYAYQGYDTDGKDPQEIGACMNKIWTKIRKVNCRGETIPSWNSANYVSYRSPHFKTDYCYNEHFVIEYYGATISRNFYSKAIDNCKPMLIYCRNGCETSSSGGRCR
jgi:hypothetical protein